ncbi:MAG: sodium-translocating pyrophosphatase [Candidatus Cloacimonadota bacterium]|nr:sodium-translocating pyrophosphatase [Candidatus Cloacimonadota bacterium]
MANMLFIIAPIASAIALVFAYLFFINMKKQDEGNNTMKEIAAHVKKGALTYLKRQYKIVAIFFFFAFIFFFILAFVLHVQSKWTPFAFLTGGFFSGLAGFLGMMTATTASNRTTQGARHSLNRALQIAFRSGAVMGLVVVGLGLLDISIWFIVLKYLVKIPNLSNITTIMLTFGMGASSMALFARVGGGIFTKAADVGADLVGKIEAGIPEDDPRNPGTIADNVGDNVGDVAGMGADLYESYCGSILATAALGASAFSGTSIQLNAVILPILIAGVGILLSIIGIFLVKTKEDATQKDLLKALGRGVNFSALLILIASAYLINLMLNGSDLVNTWGVWGSMVAGLLAGILIGKSTEYYTSSHYKPTKGIVQHSLTGPATVIIDGLAVGMQSVGYPVVIVSLGILFAFGFSGGFSNVATGLYGIGLAAVGMLSTLGITLATDAYGPIADNAGGNAEMSKLGEEVRKRTDALDALGNTTAATGKGFAIGSAALTAMALLAAYIEEVKMGFAHIGQTTFEIAGKTVGIAGASIAQFMDYYDVTLMNPKVLIGIFSGAMLAFVFCALTMKAVGRTAAKMVNEIRRQFKEIKGLLDGNAKPDYESAILISTKGAQHEMILPSLLAIIVPIFVGLILGVSGVMGLLVGGLTSGFALAIMLNNAGGAWDNAKKYVEEGHLGGKGSDQHNALIVGDTVGDPCKDTSGPSLNILIKLMSMVSIVVAGLTVAYSPAIQKFLGIF